MRKWDTFQLVFLAFCASLNVGIGAIVGIVKLPIYLDSIGTFIAAALGGWIFGAAAGILSLLISSILITPTALAYVGTAIVISICVSILVKYKFLKSIPITILGGVFIGIVAAIVSAPITTYFYGGVSLAGTDAATAFFKAMGNNLLESVILGGLATDPIDKLATSIIVFSLLKAIPKRIYHRFPKGKLFIQK